MIFPCPDAVRCPSSEFPLSNYSSEAPDPPIRLGYSTGTSPTSSFRAGGGAGPSSNPTDIPSPDQADTGTGGDPPPLDSTWDNAVVTTIVEVTDTTLDPSSVAGNQNITDLIDGTGTPGGGGLLTPQGIPPTIFINHPQTCTVNCPDGSPFQYTVPLGSFRAFAQADADRAAYSFACKQAARNALCLGSISPDACVDQPYMQTVVSQSVNLPIHFSVLGYPGWVSVTVGPNSVMFSGTPGSGDVAVSDITIFAVDSRGFTMAKPFQISVTNCTEPCMVTETSLPAFDQGQSYAAQLHATGGTAPYSWALVEGALPLGLSLSTGGAISGIATLQNGNLDSVFTVLATDSSHPPKQCEGTISLPVVDYHNFPPGKHWRIKNYSDGMFPGLSGCTTCGAPNVSYGPWNGRFEVSNTSGIFDAFSNPGSHVTIDGGRGIVPAIVANPNPLDWPHGWYVQIVCSNSFGDDIWEGRKIGSNMGSKLDSPAGDYTIQSGLVGQRPFCGTNVTVTIEEF